MDVSLLPQASQNGAVALVLSNINLINKDGRFFREENKEAAFYLIVSAFV